MIHQTAVCIGIDNYLLGYGLSRDGMRKALNIPPEFSHQRENVVPQNVNIVLPMNDPDAAILAQTSLNRANQQTTSTQRTNRKGKRRNVQPASKPSHQQVPLGQIASPKWNGQDLSAIKNASRQPTNVQQVNAEQKCTFKVPSFLLPDTTLSTNGDLTCPSFLLPGPSIDRELITLMMEHWSELFSAGQKPLPKVTSPISQVEFEQKCLIPALRAYVMAQACRTRPLKVYLEWLLYLRQRLFNI
ncbi:hypothetical protein ACF0H5_021024 [Mactra antiquata]